MLDSLRDELQSILDEIRTESGVPGISIALSVNGEALTAFSGAQIDSQTRFALGCLTKIGTTLVALELARRRVLDLDAPIAQYLSEIESAGSCRDVTARHLMTSTSAFRGLNLASVEVGYFYSWPKFLAHLQAADSLFAPGSVFSYEHSECVLLGEIIGRVTGEPVERLAEEWIYKPLDMQLGSLKSIATGYALDSAKREYVPVRQTPYCAFWSASLANLTATPLELVRLGELLSRTSAAIEQYVDLPPTSGGPRREDMPLSFGHGCARYGVTAFGRSGSSRGQIVGIRLERGLVLAVALNAWQPFVRDTVVRRISGLCGLDTACIERMPEAHNFRLEELEGTYIGSVAGTSVEVSLKDSKLACEVSDTVARLRYTLVMSEDAQRRLVMETDAEQLCAGFFRDRISGAPALMVGLSAYRKAS